MKENIFSSLTIGTSEVVEVTESNCHAIRSEEFSSKLDARLREGKRAEKKVARLKKGKEITKK